VDWGSLAGLALAFSGILLGQLLEGGHIASLVQPAAFVIVLAGTLGAVMLQNQPRNLLRGVRMVGRVFSPPPNYREAATKELAVWCVVARREGTLSLERYLDAVRDPFTAKGLRLVIDGIEPTKLKEILEAEISCYEAGERLAAKVWDAAGGYAPTVGILGAVLGLIHVMENLSDPARLGSGIAVAFVATVYGVGLANLVFLPIGNKLKTLISQEVGNRVMITDAFFGIASGENPRVIEERLGGYLGAC
jgi:chemotaxis protein MotA